MLGLGKKLSLDELREHMLATYFSLRIALALVGLALPVALLIIGMAMGLTSRPLSMSEYYTEGGRLARDVFVGGLFAVGFLLWVYKGYGKGENVLLNIAGGMAILVALVPTCPDCAARPWHIGFAVTFFICIGCVAAFCNENTLEYLRQTNPHRAKVFKKVYSVAGTSMVVGPLLAYLAAPSEKIFWAEAAGIWVFAIFWIVKTFELRGAGMERAFALNAPAPHCSTSPSAHPRRAEESHAAPSGVTDRAV